MLTGRMVAGRLYAFCRQEISSWQQHASHTSAWQVQLQQQQTAAGDLDLLNAQTKACSSQIAGRCCRHMLISIFMNMHAHAAMHRLAGMRTTRLMS